MKTILLVGLFFITNQLFGQCNGSEPQIELGNDTILCPGQTLQLTAVTGYDFYNWSNGSYNDTIVVSTAGSYFVDAGITGANLVLHGDFQGGTTAVSNNFTTSYIPGTGGSWGLLSNEGQYAISTSPSLVHNNFSNCGDHTTGSGNMLIANGSATPNITVWSQTVNVLANTDYVFSFWQMNALNATEVSSLQLYINGVAISTIVPTNVQGCIWEENSGVWNSLGVTSAVLSIVNQSTLSSGNDFAIDDIYFAPICLETDTINVVYDNIQVDAGSDISFCANDPETLVATANVTVTDYSWSNGDVGQICNPLSSGVYTVTGTSVNGCIDTDNATVNVIAVDWSISQVLAGPTDCGTNNGYVSGITSGTFQDPANFTWSGPGVGNPNQINASVWDNLSAGWYYLEIESNGCYQYDSVEVIANNPPIAGLSANPASGYNPLNVTFTNSSQNANSFSWDFGNGNSTTTNDLSSQNQVYTTSGVFSVMLIAYNGACSDTAYVSILVTDPPVSVPVSLETSNVFTPDNDGINDVYQFKLENIVELDLTILNRWGQEVFNTTNVSATWDGKSRNGAELEEGVYFYIYKAVGAQEEQFGGHGFIHLVRSK